MTIDQIPIDYYPLINGGHTLEMAGKIDPWRMYCDMAIYEISEIGIYQGFEFSTEDSIYAEYHLLEVNASIDYAVIVSLN